MFQYQQNQNNQNQQQLQDKDILHDMLMTEKHVSSTYDVGILESSKPQVRQTMQQIQQEEQEHAEEIYKAMQQRGWYSAQ